MIEALTRERDEARETNRALNRVNQKLQSDIAADRHLLNEYPTSEQGRYVDARDRALISFAKRAREAEAACAALQAAFPQSPEPKP